MRINTCGLALTGFQIQLYFDSNVIVAEKDGEDESGNDWPGTITYTYGSPSTMVQLLSSEPTSSKKGNKMLLTTLTFEVVGDGATWISGVVVDSLTSGGVSLGDANRAMVAGFALFETSGLRARNRILYPGSSSPPRRQLQETKQSLRGDTNGDGRFTVSDLDFIKRYYVGDTSLEFVSKTAQVWNTLFFSFNCRPLHYTRATTTNAVEYFFPPMCANRNDSELSSIAMPFTSMPSSLNPLPTVPPRCFVHFVDRGNGR